MKILEDMILERGIAVNEDILKVDSFVNHRKFRHCSGTDDGSCPECTDADLKKAAF